VSDLHIPSVGDWYCKYLGAYSNVPLFLQIKAIELKDEAVSFSPEGGVISSTMHLPVQVFEGFYSSYKSVDQILRHGFRRLDPSDMERTWSNRFLMYVQEARDAFGGDMAAIRGEVRARADGIESLPRENSLDQVISSCIAFMEQNPMIPDYEKITPMETIMEAPVETHVYFPEPDEDVSVGEEKESMVVTVASVEVSGVTINLSENARLTDVLRIVRDLN
tara:strand:- start:415 stop:1077 length:663 start_codon:yes stop_codon:yes gene_type:complete